MEHANERKNFRIGEVAKMFKVKTSLLRFWETEFEQLKPLKTKGGERIYRAEHIKLIAQIHDLTKEKGYTLAGAKEILTISNHKLEIQQDITQRLKKVRTILEGLKKELEE
ncbi:MAG: MerR family transcriptional regulator [Bacteroidia bacterium]|nr:MerR family transcriptional regulator [Bacteroidia bacterium]MCO5254135.1 MerR family transcriptional regulator [Bacteroidota bacterium]MCZ2129941.1 MerR family transcriptional regulator [Bacteroidia bacterium]